MQDARAQRYSRQIVLSEIGREGQNALIKAKILCVGIGGLGSPAALYLAAAGVGTLGLVDDDIVDLTNLQRQILFRCDEEGASKAQVAAKRLNDLNPEVAIRTYRTRLTAANAVEILSGYDVVIDGTDNFAAKFLLNDTCVKLGVPLIYGSVAQFEGQIGVFWARKGACYRCLFPIPPESTIPNCSEAGILGALAGMVGSMQALEAIKIVLNTGGISTELRPLYSKVTIIDSGSMAISAFSVPKVPTCPICSGPPESITLPVDGARCAPRQAFSAVPGLTSNDILVDVREETEWLKGHIPGAIHWPLSLLQRGEIPDVDKSKRYVIYCQSGIRSERALHLLAHEGFMKLDHFRPGFNSWNGRVEKAQ